MADSEQHAVPAPSSSWSVALEGRGVARDASVSSKVLLRFGADDDADDPRDS